MARIERNMSEIGSEGLGRVQVSSEKEAAVGSPLSGLNNVGQQVVRRAAFERLFPAIEQRERLLKDFLPEQINTIIDSQLSKLSPDQMDEFINSSLAQHRRQMAVQRTDKESTPIVYPEVANEQQDLTVTNTKEANGRNGPPEGPRGPESGDKEWEASPERGRWICDEIVRLRTEFTYSERYKIIDKEGRPYLKWLYKELQEYVDKLCEIRHERDPWAPINTYKAIQEAQKRNPEYVEPKPGEQPPESQEQVGEQQAEEQDTQAHNLTAHEEDPQSVGDAEYLASKSVEEHQKIIANLTREYEDDDTSAVRMAEVRKALAIYFREARRKGLLQGADLLLNTTYQKHIRTGELDAVQIEEVIKQTMDQAQEGVKRLWRARRADDPEIDRLKGVWGTYTKWAREVLDFAKPEQDSPASLKEKGAFEFVQQEMKKGRETYWKPGSWTGYYVITAKTPEQFKIAAATFLQMIRRGSIGKSPEELYKHLQNFKEQFGTTGDLEVSNQAEDDIPEGQKLTSEFMKELRLEFEALSYIFGADYSNETYNPKSYNQFMMAMALHEGPERWVALYRSREGAVAAFTDMFDHRSFMRIFNNPAGDQGELDVVAQHFLEDQIKEMAIEKGMGIQLKDYHPGDTDPDSPVKLAKSKKAAQARAKYLQKNLKRLGIPMSRKELGELYEGFEGGNTHKNRYQEYILKKKLTVEQLQQLPDRLQESIKLGAVQVELEEIRARIRSGAIKTDKNAIEYLKEQNPEAYKLYQDAYSNAEANFDVAFQMQGATGEKIRRGQGFFYVDRNVHVQVYNDTREGDENSRRIGHILTQIKKGRKLDIFTWEEKSKARQENAAKLERICADIKTGKQLNEKDLIVYNTALSAFRAQLEQIKNRADQDSAHILNGIFGESDVIFRGLYEGISSNIHKTNYEKFKKLNPNILSKLPARLRMSITFGRIKQENKKEDQLNKYDRLIYDTVQDQRLYESLDNEERINIVDHLPVHIAKDAVQYVVNRTKIQYANAPVAVRRRAVNEARQYATNQIQFNGHEAKFRLPKIIFDEEGDVVGTGEEFDEVSLIAASESPLARYNTHTYYAYQPENRHELLSKRILDEAKQIRRRILDEAKQIESGESQLEYKDMLAMQRLIVDPTLNRITKMEGDLIEEEITIMNAAVEESYQDYQQIVRDLYAAFLPKTGNRGRMRVGYIKEDWGGSIRFAAGCRELVASQPARFARRLGAGIAFIPMEIDSMPAIWGQDGVAGIIHMFADPIYQISHQRDAGQFGITKFIDQMSYGERLRIALFGQINQETGKEQEGLYKKPTNNSEELSELEQYSTTIKEGNSPAVEVRFLHAILKSFGRLDEVIKLIGAEASLVRNAQGVLWLKDKEIFLPDGSYNSEEIDKDNDTGTARHSEKIFFDSFIDWLLRKGEGGGAEAYPQEQWWYKHLEEPCVLNPKITRREWLFNKMYSG